MHGDILINKTRQYRFLQRKESILLRFSLQETRRQAAAEAANRRFQQSQNRGVDEDELRRLKQRQADRDRLEAESKKLPTQTDGLRVRQLNSFFLIFQSFILVANELISFCVLFMFL